MSRPVIRSYHPLWSWLALSIVAACGSGCFHHRIAFEENEMTWHYQINAMREHAAIVVVIDQATLDRTERIKSSLTGFNHVWEPEPGKMLKQVADNELPQMFAEYECATSYREPAQAPRRLILVMTIQSYTFKDFEVSVSVSVRAIAYRPGQVMIFDKTYNGEGAGEGGKVATFGAFGMKSAVRQSTLDAYKQVFDSLRPDLKDALTKPASLGL
jgi:hypothetical protein